MSYETPNSSEAPFNMAVATLMRLDSILKQIRVLDEWLTSGWLTGGGISYQSWVDSLFPTETAETLVQSPTADIISNTSESDLMNAYNKMYGDNIEEASKKLKELKTELTTLETGITTVEKNTETATSSTGDTFKAYNLTRFAHVKKAFSNYSRYGDFLVIKNEV